ncbi:hypothetical protein AOQ84DRAFT_89180 [Glonium stellatum]|uniref:Uncharacterized protein n=1 Tax=Glonium stellatum TaxID=574774 RepID=A0A8E2EVY4_9PEZI|nr:hypothetical protein AOQ84DRAFT_89180 [Glonium stellatum]
MDRRGVSVEVGIGFSSHIWLFAIFAIVGSDARCIAIGFSSHSPASSFSMESIAFHKSGVTHIGPLAAWVCRRLVL